MRYPFTAEEVAEHYPGYGHCHAGWCPDCFEKVVIYTGPEGDHFYCRTCEWEKLPGDVPNGAIVWEHSIVEEMTKMSILSVMRYRCPKCNRPVFDIEVINKGAGPPFNYHDICGAVVEEIV